MIRRKKRPAAEITADMANSLPKHPRQADLVASAIRLLANDVLSAASPDAPLTDEEAMSGATAEFDKGVASLFFDPDEDRFCIVWSSPAWSRLLKPYLVAAWEEAPGEYGSKPPMSHEPKRKPSNLH